MPAFRPAAFLLLALASAGAAPAFAQSFVAPVMPASAEPEPAPAEPAVMTEAELKAAAERRKRLTAAEQDLRRIRGRHFATTNTEIRQLGIAKIRTFTDPWFYDLLVSTFAAERDDVIAAVMDHLAAQDNPDADQALARAAIDQRSAGVRDAATARLVKRFVAAERPASQTVLEAVGGGLGAKDDRTVARAAQLAYQLKLYEAIPALIAAQVRPNNLGDGSTNRSLAYIVIGQQQAFVSDLVPVVGDGVVAFDPQLDVFTTGTVLRIIDAVVVEYNTVAHAALLDLSRDGWGGRSTAHLGYNAKAWFRWYDTEFLPYRKSLAAAKTAAPAPVQPPAPAATPAPAPAPAPLTLADR